MNEHQALMEKREEARQAILALKDKTPTARVFILFSQAFPKSIKEQGLIYWPLQIVLINAVIILPGLLLSWILGEIQGWPSDIASWFAAIELAIYAFILSHILFQLVFSGIANHVVNKIADPEDMSVLISYCKSSALSAYTFLVAGGILWPIWAFVAIDQFAGIGLTYMTIPTGCLIGGSFQVVFWAMALTNQLKGFRYELNTFSPANSEVVVRLSSMLNKIIYLTGAFFVVLTLLVSSGFLGSQVNKAFGFPLTLLGWTIILVQFLVNRSTINGIIDKARWSNLNKLQAQMNAIQEAEDLSNKDVSERLLRLADLYERVRSNRSGNLDAKSLLNLFSQLMLPLLGLVLGNNQLMEFLNNLFVINP